MPIKKTKKAKSISVKYETIKSFRARWTCPGCKIEFVGGTPSQSVIVFTCSHCGQLLKIEDRTYAD